MKTRIGEDCQPQPITHSSQKGVCEFGDGRTDDGKLFQFYGRNVDVAAMKELRTFVREICGESCLRGECRYKLSISVLRGTPDKPEEVLEEKELCKLGIF